MFKETYQKIFFLLVILTGVVLNVFLALTVTTGIGIKAVTSSAEFYFDPPTADISSPTGIRLMVNPVGQEIGFLTTVVFFDPALINLSSSVVIAPPEYEQVTPITSLVEANQNGFIEVTLSQRSGIPAPTQNFELLTMQFRSAPGAASGPANLTLIDEDTMLVAADETIIPFTVRYSDITVRGATADRAAAKSQQGSCGEASIDTAIGCIPFSDTDALARFFLTWGMGIAGGIAFILIVMAGYQIITSSGDPKRLQAGKELLVAAVTGLLMLIFSAFILRFIGVDFLKIF